MNLENYNYMVKSYDGIFIMEGKEYHQLKNKEVYITEYEAVRGYLRLKNIDKDVKLYKRIPNTTKWIETDIDELLKNIKKIKTKKANRTLKGVDKKW